MKKLFLTSHLIHLLPSLVNQRQHMKILSFYNGVSVQNLMFFCEFVMNLMALTRVFAQRKYTNFFIFV